MINFFLFNLTLELSYYVYYCALLLTKLELVVFILMPTMKRADDEQSATAIV